LICLDNRVSNAGLIEVKDLTGLIHAEVFIFAQEERKSLLFRKAPDDADVAKIEARINEIFGATSSPNGDSVSVNFSNASGDFNLDLSSASNSNLGEELHIAGISFKDPTVFIGTNQQSYGSNWQTGAGTTGAHELTHRIAGGANSYPDERYNGAPNLMNVDNAIKNHHADSASHDDTTSPPSGFAKLTPQQVAKLFKKCIKKQKKKGGGGGGGPDDTILPRPGPPSGDGGFGGGDPCPDGDCGSHPPCYPNCTGPNPTLKTRGAALEPDKLNMHRWRYENVEVLSGDVDSVFGRFFFAWRHGVFDRESKSNADVARA
jgi:hypothetical protein